jgi:hypothetical protein
MRNCDVDWVHVLPGNLIWSAYVERSRINIFSGDNSTRMYIGQAKVLNSYVNKLVLDVAGLSQSIEVRNCHIGALDLSSGRFGTIELNAIDTITWSYPDGTHPLRNNNIDSTNAILLSLDSQNDADATGNHWNAAATAQMKAGVANIAAIHDFFDDPNLGRVNYSGFLENPVPNAGPTW